MTTWMAVLAVGIASYALRVAPLTVQRLAHPTVRMATLLRHAGIAAIGALVVQSVRAHAAGDGVRLASTAAALAVGAWCARRGRSLAVVVLAGWGAAASVTAALSAV